MLSFLKSGKDSPLLGDNNSDAGSSHEAIKTDSQVSIITDY